MTVLTLNRKELEKKVGKIDKKMEETISMLGFPVEEIKDDEVSIEIFPNRPDALSMPGFARALQFYLGKKKPYEFKVHKPEKSYEVKIEKPEKKWPYAVCAIVKNLKFDDEKIKELIDIQEKLTLTIGRKRKKLGLGVYPLEQLKLPITYTAKNPEDIKFQPLEFPKEIIGRQILSQHPTGREYGHLIESWEKFPVFIDANNEILSMPPIINSHKTGKVKENTTDLFVECTGNNLAFIKKALHIMVTALSDMGGEVYQMKILDEAEKKSFLTPNFDSEEMKFKIENINKTLGLDLKEKDMKKLLEKMGIGYEKGKAIIPAYRIDILHWIDLAEEIAIAYGYDKFEPEIPKISTIAKEDQISVFKSTSAEILVGLGLQEVSSYHLTTKESIKNVCPAFKEFIEVEESKTEYNILRPDLLTNLLKILHQNSDSAYPQKIFEIGRVFSLNDKSETGVQEKEKLAVAITHETANFTELKQILDYFLRMIEKEYKIIPENNPAFIDGRAGKILINNKNIGIIGEISPRVLKDCKIKMPVAAFELEFENLA